MNNLIYKIVQSNRKNPGCPPRTEGALSGWRGLRRCSGGLALADLNFELGDLGRKKFLSVVVHVHVLLQFVVSHRVRMLLPHPPFFSVRVRGRAAS